MNKIIKKTGVANLKCILTDKERLGMGTALAEAGSRKNGLDRELDSLKKQLGGKIKMCEAEIERIQEIILVGYEFRNVKTETEFDYTDATVQSFRLDTGENIEDRPMTSDERQVKIQFENFPVGPDTNEGNEEGCMTIKYREPPEGTDEETVDPDDLEPGA